MKTGDRTYTSCISVLPSRTVFYTQCVESHHSTGVRIKNQTKTPEELSRKAANRIKDAIGWMLLFSNRKTVYVKDTKKTHSFVLNFITLTLTEAQKHDDRYIVNHMLAPFLKWLGRNHARLYVWKAEIQDNGNLHFHITTNTFIHWKKIQFKWNRILRKHGYKIYNSETHEPCNSSDIKAVKNEKQTARYMAKYMTKNKKYLSTTDFKRWKDHVYQSELYKAEQDEKGVWRLKQRKINCRIWASCEALSNLRLKGDEHDAVTERDQIGTIAAENYNDICKFIWSRSKDEDKHTIKGKPDMLTGIEPTIATVVYHQNLKYMGMKGAIRHEVKKVSEKIAPYLHSKNHFQVESLFKNGFYEFKN